LRPEHIGVGRPSANAADVPATLRLAEHMGNEVFVHAEVAGLPLTARVPADEAEALHSMARGTPITLYLRMDASHLFDSGSGVSLT
jgi:ABC-type sugar transport system ATPase subunit